VFYRLVAAHNYPKETDAAKALGELLNDARRGEHIPFGAIRDDGIVIGHDPGFESVADFDAAVRNTANKYRLDGRLGQPVTLELYCEAAGMVPQLQAVADSYGVPVTSSGGFNSVTGKHALAGQIANDDRPTVVLQVGDHDASGCSIIDSLASDTTKFVEQMGGKYVPTFHRIAITPEQIDLYGVVTSPPKDSDKRGDFAGPTAQAEALPPDLLAQVVRDALTEHVDLDILEATREREQQERAEILENLK